MCAKNGGVAGIGSCAGGWNVYIGSMSHESNTPRLPDADISASRVAGQRRVIRARGLEPLAPERRYVQPEASRAGFAPLFFGWAREVAPQGKEHGRRVKVGKPALMPEGTGGGLNAPAQRRKQARFNQYFELGTGIRLPAAEGSQEDRIRRNRVLFLLTLAAVAGYCIYWMTA